MNEIENKHNILKYKYELGTLMAILRLMLAIVAGAGAYYLYNKYGAGLLSGYDKAVAKPLIFAVIGAAFSIYLFITTFIALIVNGKPNRDVILTASHITSPKSVTSLSIVEIALADIINIELVQENSIGWLRRFVKQTDHRKLVIVSDSKKLAIKTEGFKNMKTFDQLFANLVARLPAKIN